MGREGIRFLALSPLMSIANGLLCFLATRSVFVEHRPRDGKNGDSQTVTARQGAPRSLIATDTAGTLTPYRNPIPSTDERPPGTSP
jgi:hypothetical protein